MSIFEIRSFLGLAGYYRRFENGLKLSIRGRIIGFLLVREIGRRLLLHTSFRTRARIEHE